MFQKKYHKTSKLFFTSSWKVSSKFWDYNTSILFEQLSHVSEVDSYQNCSNDQSNNSYFNLLTNSKVPQTLLACVPKISN